MRFSVIFVKDLQV